MRLLDIDKKTFWYANYTGRTMIETGGNSSVPTGERSTSYGTPAQAEGTFSINTGAATPREFGTYIDYDYVIHMDDDVCPFDEDAAIWMSDPVIVGNNNTTTLKDPEFRVLRISDLRTHIAVAIRQMR